MLEYPYIIAGSVVGLLIGMTGIGGGSLMAPILIFLGVNPAKVVGTDLFFASITKLSSFTFFLRSKQINWKIVKLLSLGSIPASLFTLFLLRWLDSQGRLTNLFFQKAIGIMVMSIAFIYLIKSMLRGRFLEKAITARGFAYRGILTVFFGALIGGSVTLTSIGAGVLGTVILMALYSEMSPTALIATEITHAIPLALLAGLGHVSLGNVDIILLANLTLGSLPAAYIGSKLSNIVPASILRVFLSCLLLFVSAKLL